MDYEQAWRQLKVHLSGIMESSKNTLLTNTALSGDDLQYLYHKMHVCAAIKAMMEIAETTDSTATGEWESE